jgi:hypothetical protein
MQFPMLNYNTTIRNDVFEDHSLQATSNLQPFKPKVKFRKRFKSYTIEKTNWGSYHSTTQTINQLWQYAVYVSLVYFTHHLSHTSPTDTSHSLSNYSSLRYCFTLPHATMNVCRKELVLTRLIYFHNFWWEWLSSTIRLVSVFGVHHVCYVMYLDVFGCMFPMFRVLHASKWPVWVGLSFDTWEWLRICL